MKDQAIIATDPRRQSRQLKSFETAPPTSPWSPSFHEAVEQVYFKISRGLPPSIDFGLSLSRGAQEIFGDYSLLERVLEGLVTQSRKCLPLGGHIHVTTELADFHRQVSRASTGHYIRLQVSCWGAGLNPDNILRQEEQSFEQININLRIGDLASVVRALNGTVRTIFRDGKLVFDILLRVDQYTDLDGCFLKAPVILLMQPNAQAYADLGDSLASLDHQLLRASSPEDLMSLSDGYNADIDVLVLAESVFRVHSRTVNTFLLERPFTSVLLFAEEGKVLRTSVWPIARKVMMAGRHFTTEMIVKEVERLLDDQSPTWMTDPLM